MSGFSVELFRNPPVEHAVIYAWEWNGPVTREGILKQLTDMGEAGIRGLYVLPEPKDFRPVTMPTSMEPDYMSDEYLEMIKYLCDTAKQMGFSVWLYDEGGWPSGGVCNQISRLRPDLRRKYISCIPIALGKGASYTPPLDHPDLLACFLKDGSGNYVRIFDKVVQNGEYEILEYRCMWYELGMFLPDGTDYVTDLMHPDTVKLFLELTHEKYAKALGAELSSYISGMFDDEPSVGFHPWTPGMEKQFRSAYGYDILDYLPVLKEQIPAESPAQKQALSDWRKLVCSLVLKNFFIPMREWCRAHGLRLAGHLNGEHDLDVLMHNPAYSMPLEVLRCYDIPAVDAIWRQIYPKDFGLPPAERVISFYPRIASSAAAQNGSGLAMTESMSIYGEARIPSVTRYVFGAQAVRGINVFNFNTVPYKVPKIRPGIRPENPCYTHLKTINSYLERLSYVAQLGTAVCDSALYIPWTDISRGERADGFHAMGEHLERQNIYFDLIDDAFVRQAQIRDGALCMGFAAYRNVFVPEGSTLPADVKERLSGFIVQQAQPLVVCANPELRFQKRKLEDGSVLYLVFNESKDPQHAELAFAETGLCYRLFLEDGRIEICCDLTVDLVMGETAVFLFTEAGLPAEMPMTVEKEIPLSGPFTLEKVKEFQITREGVRLDSAASEPKDAVLGRWDTYFTDRFSGQAVYRTQFRLDNALIQEGKFLLDLGEVEYTAAVKLNGKAVGIAALQPHRIRLDAGLLREENVLEIAVANTASNRTTTADIFSLFSMAEIGPYHSKEVAMEREFIGGGLIGPITLKTLTLPEPTAL